MNYIYAFLYWLFIFHWLYYFFVLVFALIFPLLLPSFFKINGLENTEKKKRLNAKEYFFGFSKIFVGGFIIVTIFIFLFDFMLLQWSAKVALLAFVALIIVSLIRIRHYISK